MKTIQSKTVDPSEAKKFSELADQWWEEEGKFSILHRFNPIRLEYIRDNCLTYFQKKTHSNYSFSSLDLLDIGCGGGLLSEPLARIGFHVTGIDITQRNIEAARIHAKQSNLSINYQLIDVETLAQQGKKFDIILNMEVVEHVADVPTFLKNCSDLLNPGGLMFCATLNRTLRSFIFGIVGAEYILNLLPRGTHNWKKFLTPLELEKHFQQNGLSLYNKTGIEYNPITRRFSLSHDMAINYILVMYKPHTG